MFLGEQIVVELRKRQIVGQFFDYADYQKLKQVKDSGELRQFLLQSNYQFPPNLMSAREAVDYLIAVNTKLEQEEGKWFWAEVLSVLVGPFAYFVFLSRHLILRLSRGSRKRL